MRRVFVLLLVLLLTLSGCKTSSKNGGYQLYFRVDPETSTHGAAIAGQNYPGREEPGVEELFAALMAGPTQNGLVSPFPQGVTLHQLGAVRRPSHPESLGAVRRSGRRIPCPGRLLSGPHHEPDRRGGFGADPVRRPHLPLPQPPDHDLPGSSAGSCVAPPGDLLTNGPNLVTLIHYQLNVIKRPETGLKNRKKEFP